MDKKQNDKLFVMRSRIADSAHKCMQWENGEITGFDMIRFEQMVDGILDQLYTDKKTNNK